MSNRQPRISHFDSVTTKWENLKHMNERRAACMRDFIHEHAISDILELGFAHGKSSAYLGAILEDQGGGHLLTIDLQRVQKFTPNIHDVLSSLSLEHRVTAQYAQRSYTWELQKMISRDPRPQFDMCYLDGGHTWDVTGFGFFLVDLLLKPGGWIVFDDLNWTPQAFIERNGEHGQTMFRSYSDDERRAAGVRLVWNLLVPHLGYENAVERTEFQWGFARKPLSSR